MDNDLGGLFGAALRRARLERELTQVEVAGRAGITVRQLARYEAGTPDPALSMIVTLARAVETAPADLVRDAVAPHAAAA